MVLGGSVVAGQQPARASASIVVTTLNDETSGGDGCSLREAMGNVNDQAQTYADCASGTGVNNVTFTPGMSGTITLGSALPTMSQFTSIDGGVTGGRAAISLDAHGHSRHFVVASGVGLVLQDLNLLNGHAPDGPDGTSLPGADGGSILDSGALSLAGVRISGSQAGTGASELGTPGVGGNGGAVAVKGGSASLTGSNVTFDNDQSGRSGINGANNHPFLPGFGGGIYNGGGSVSLTNATFAYDSVGLSFGFGTTRGGGGIYSDGGTVSLSFSTFAANSVGGSLTQPGLAVYSDHGASVTLDSSIVGDDLSSTSHGTDCYTGDDGSNLGSIHDGGSNLEFGTTCNFTASSSLQSTDPQYYWNTTQPPLQGFGLVPTVALQSSSPAIDLVPSGVHGCGTSLTTDARGVDRPYPAGGACDAGAFESQPVPQNITFAQPPLTATYGSTFQVAPTSDSGLAVTVNASGGCSVAAASGGGYTVTMTSGVTTCALTASQAGDVIFAAATPVERDVAASTAPLSVTAANKSITFGHAAPSFTVNYSGFVLKDGASSLGGSLVFTFSGTGATTYGPSTTVPTAVGTYAITPSGYTSDNYLISYTAGTYTISTASQSITVTTAAPASAPFDSTFTVAATGGGSGQPIVYGSSGVCSNTGATYTMTSGTGTCTVTFDQAGDGNYTAAPQVTESVTAEKLAQTVAFTSTAPAAAVYGDSYTPNATGGGSGNPVAFGASGQCSYSSGTVTMTSSGSCTVSASQPGDDDYSDASTVTQVFSVGVKPATLGFTGSPFWSTGSAGATSTSVTLSGTVTPAAGGSVDLTNAPVTFLLYRSTNLSMSSPDATCAATVNAAGVASCVIVLGVDNWTVAMMMPTNAYFGASESDPAVLTVYAPVSGRSAVGAGWILDPGAGGRAHFGFSVRYKSGSTPTGQSEYVFRGSDGFEYVVRSNSWSGGVLAFPASNAVAFTGKCNVAVIDPTSGREVTSYGNYSFRVDATQGTPNTYAISIYTATGALFRQAGTTRSPLAVGGGTVVIHAR